MNRAGKQKLKMAQSLPRTRIPLLQTLRAIALTLILACLASAQGSAPKTAAPSSGAQPVPQDDNARHARALLDQMIQAMGGQAWLNIKDVSQEGRTYGFYHGKSGGGAPFWRFAKWPDMERLELTKQRDWIIIHNGDQGWEITFRGTAPEDPEEHEAYLLRRPFTLEHVLREWLDQPGTALFYEGRALAERKEAEKVTVLNSQNQPVSFYIDIFTHLPIKKSFQHRNPLYRDQDVEDEVYDNWHTVQGIPTALDITRMHNGESTNQRFLNKVTYNSGLPDSMFSATVAIKGEKPDEKKK